MGRLMKTARVLKGNICNLFAVLMSLCDSDTKNQNKASTEDTALEISIDSMGLLSVIKMLVYNILSMRHNKAMVHMNLMTQYQERFQFI